MKLFKYIYRLSLFLFVIQLIATSLLKLSLPREVSYFFAIAQGIFFLSYVLLLVTYSSARASHNKKKQIRIVEEQEQPTVFVQTRNNYRNTQDRRDKIA